VLPVLREQARAIDANASFPVDGLTALRQSGLMGLLIPAKAGGLGGDLADLVHIAAELAGECLSTAMIWAMHCQQVVTLVRHATPALRQDLLPRISRGEVYIASVTSEARKGGHLLTADAPLRRDGDGIAIRREAPIVTGGRYADGFLITMRDHPLASPNAVSLVYADRADVKLTLSGSWDPMGMRGTHSVALGIEGRVDGSHLVGEPGGFDSIAMSTFAPAGHLAWSACWLGAARAAYRSVLHLLRDGKRGSGMDVRSELLRTRLARVRLDLDTVAALLAQVLRDVQAAPDIGAVQVQLRLNELKVLAAERTFAAVDTLVDVTGLRHGYLRDGPLPLERIFRDLRSAGLNYSNDRLLLANGALTMFDREVTLAY
jgi:acyl-CoA dehydrogenase